MAASDPQSVVKAGDIVEGRYRIVRLIDDGGMSSVYLAEHVLIKRRVALKLLRPDLAVDAEAVDRFMKEASAAGTLGHPHIVESTDMGFTREGIPFIVFEFLEGSLLTEEIYRLGGLTMRRALAIATQIASALEAAHAAQIIHRDLKTDNVFLTVRDGYSDHVKVLDFGVSRFADGESDSSRQRPQIIGTPEYLAPEQILAPDAIDHRVDIYALGLVLYEMLTARRAFTSDGDTEALLKRIVSEPPPPISAGDAPPALQELLFGRLLAKDPTHRLASMRDVQLALVEVSGTMRPSGSIPPFRTKTPMPFPIPRTPTLDPAGSGPMAPVKEPEPEPAAAREPPSERETSPEPPGREAPEPVEPPPAPLVITLSPATKPASKPRRRGLGAALVVAGLVAAGAGFALHSVREVTIEPEPVDLNLGLHAEKLAATLDQSLNALRLRAEGIASSPMLRAAIETDAATLRDMLRDSDFVFTPREGEVLEVFQRRGDSTSSLLRVPDHAAPLEAAEPPRLIVREREIVARTGVPVLSRDGKPMGVLVIAAPVDTTSVRRGLSEVTTASLEGLGTKLPLVEGTPDPGMLVAEQRLPVALRGSAQQASLVMTFEQPPARVIERYGALRHAAWGAGGVLVVLGLVVLLRRRG